MAQSSFTVDGIASGGSGTVTSVATSAPISGGPITTTGTISLANASVTPGTYTNANITVDAHGLVQGATNGSSATGIIVQVLSTTLTSTFTTITAQSTFVNVPGLAVTITPTSSTSDIYVTWDVCAATGTGETGFMQVVRGTTPICIGDTAGSRTRVSNVIAPGSGGNNGNILSSSNSILDSPATTSPVTYQVQIANDDGSTTVCVNQTNQDTNAISFARAASTITVMEVLA